MTPFPDPKRPTSGPPFPWFFCLIGVLSLLVFLAHFASFILFSLGCSSFIEGATQTALSKALEVSQEKAHQIVHPVVENLPPEAPPPGSSWTDYGIWTGSVLLGSLAILIDRRYFHGPRSNQPNK